MARAARALNPGIAAYLAGPVAVEMRIRGERVAELARTLAPVGRQPGRRGGASSLRGSIRVLNQGVDAFGPYVDVGSDLEYALYVEVGTDPHIIRPRTKRALWWEGADHPVPVVNHPGAKAKPYLRPALIAGR